MLAVVEVGIHLTQMAPVQGVVAVVVLVAIMEAQEITGHQILVVAAALPVLLLAVLHLLLLTVVMAVQA